MRCAVLFVLIFLLHAGCGDGNPSYLPKPRPSADDEPPPPQPPAAVAVAANQPAAANPSEPVTTTIVPPAKAPDQNFSERDRRTRVINQLRNLHGAFERYRERNSGYPPRTLGPNGGLSWRVTLLPMLGLTDLYTKFNLAEPWDSSHNKRLLDQIPDAYKAAEFAEGKTRMLMIYGSETAGRSADGLSQEGCPDGLANTIFLVEGSGALATPWTAPNDYQFVPKTVQNDLFSLHRDCGFVALAGDGGPRRVAANISDADLMALITPDGGEVIQVNQVAQYPYPEEYRNLLTALEKNPIIRFAKKEAQPDSMTVAATAPSGADKSALKEPVKAGPAYLGPIEKRHLVPSDDELSKAATLVRDLFGAEYKAAKTPDQLRNFAQKLLDEAVRMTADPVGMFVLFRAGRDVAAQSGDVETAVRAVDRMATLFQINVQEQKEEVLTKAAPAIRNEAQAATLLQHALDLGDAAVARDDFASAKSLYTIAGSAAKRADNASWAARVRVRVTEYEAVKTAYARVSAHVHTLLREPANPEANAEVGRYLALVKRDWRKGMEMLVCGNDVTLRGFAELELASTLTPDQMIQVADGWWEWSEKATREMERTQAKQRAVYWYRSALPQLSGTLTKVRAEKRAMEVAVDRPAGTMKRE